MRGGMGLKRGLSVNKLSDSPWHALREPLSLFLLLAVTAACYWPGLSGPFLLDDFNTIERLGDFGGVHDWETFRLYVLGGGTGPTGRPLSLLSFLIDATGWGQGPWRFKLSNLILHLLNGGLLFAFCRRLMTLRGWTGERAAGFALLVAGIWLLHPLNVSTTLYVVQRMTQLSALFVLLGMNGYLHGRMLLASQPRRAYPWISASLLLAGGLAVLSKENGALLPIYLLIMESTVLAGVGVAPARAWRLPMLWLPLVLLLGGLIWAFASGWIQHVYEDRPFTPGQRLLTEARVLWDYLGQWLLPRPHGRGLYAEDYPLSTGLWRPWTTLPALLGCAGLLAVAVLRRRRWPLLAFAIGMFFAGQLIESTVIPLEIYFEHRNYLPAMFLAMPLAYWLVTVRMRPPWKAMAVAVLLVLPALMLVQRAWLWGDEARLSLRWAHDNPASQRAQRVMALVLERQGRPDRALEWLIHSEAALADNIAIHIHELGLRCKLGRDPRRGLRRLNSLLRRVPYDFRTYEAMHSLLGFIEGRECAGLGAGAAQGIIDALGANPNVHRLPGARRQIAFFQGELHVREGQADAALARFLDSQALDPDADAGLLEVAMLASAGMYPQALEMLARVRAIVAARPRIPVHDLGHLDYRKEIDRLEGLIRKDLADAATATAKGRAGP